MDIPAVDSDWSLLAELLLRLVHLPHKVGELPAQLGHALLGPVGELELAHGARLAVPRVRHLELAQEVLRHVVLGQGVHHEALVPRRPVRRPVLRALLLEVKDKRGHQTFIYRDVLGLTLFRALW